MPRGLESDPLVTVVLPTFDRGAFLLEAVQSVVGQTYRNWELIVVDDGSTDCSVEKLEALAEPRLRIERLTHCGRVARLRNLGAAAGTGELIAFLDSDDLWLPQRLERQIAVLAEGIADWCCSNVEVIDESGKRIPLRFGSYTPLAGRLARALLLEETAAWIITMLLPRRLFDRIGGFDEAFLRYEDLDFAVRLAECSDGIALSEVLALTREHSDRMTRARGHPHEQAALVYENALTRAADPELAPALEARLANHLTRAARSRLGDGDFRRGFELARRARARGASAAQNYRAFAGGAAAFLGLRK